MNNYKSNDNRKKFSIPISIIILLLVIIVLCIVFSFNIYANGNNDTIGHTEEQNNSSENTLVLAEIEIQDNNEVPSELENKKENLHTASNGEKYSIIGKLNIPNLNIKYDILSSCSTELLKISLNRYWGSYPNEVGNMVVIGHNYKNNKFFSNLQKIKKGDIVKITDNKGKTLDYSVYDTSVIDPYDNSCTSQLTDGHTEITLITCYYEKGNSHATKRFVVKARAY